MPLAEPRSVVAARPTNPVAAACAKNLSDKEVVLFIGDVRRDPNDHNM
jgi:hypothetical protein